MFPFPCIVPPSFIFNSFSHLLWWSRICRDVIPTSIRETSSSSTASSGDGGEEMFRSSDHAGLWVEAQAGLGTWYRIGMYYTDSSMASGSKQDGLSHSIKVAILVPPRYSICLSTIMWTDRLHWAYFYGKAGCRSQPSDPSLCLLFYGVKKCDNFDFACLAPPVIMFFSISFWSGFHGFTRRPTYNASPKEHCAVHKSI